MSGKMRRDIPGKRGLVLKIGPGKMRGKKGLVLKIGPGKMRGKKRFGFKNRLGKKNTRL